MFLCCRFLFIILSAPTSDDTSNGLVSVADSVVVAETLRRPRHAYSRGLCGPRPGVGQCQGWVRRGGRTPAGDTTTRRLEGEPGELVIDLLCE